MSETPLYPPPADAKEWTCPTCGMDILYCEHGKREQPQGKVPFVPLTMGAFEWHYMRDIADKVRLDAPGTYHNNHELSAFHAVREIEAQAARADAEAKRADTLQDAVDVLQQSAEVRTADAMALKAELAGYAAAVHFIRQQPGRTWCCRFHPTDWFHEVGCPHCEWTREQLIEAGYGHLLAASPATPAKEG